MSPACFLRGPCVGLGVRLGLLGMLGIAGVGVAQSAAHPPLAPFTNADTTRDVRGHVDFSAYHTSNDCLAAVKLARRELVRDPGRDTLPVWLHLVDTLPPAVRVVGTRCQEQFSIATVAPWEFESALHLAVLMGDSARSTATLERWVASPQTPRDRNSGETPTQTIAQRLDSAITWYLNNDNGASMEANISVAQTLLTRLDALGSSASGDRLLMQEKLTPFTNGTWKLTHMADPHHMLRDMLALLAARDSLNKAGITVNMGLKEVWGGLDARSFFDPTGTVAFADSVASTWKAPKMQRVADLLRELARIFTQGIGQPVPPLEAQFWYNTRDDARWPVPGRVSLLVMGDKRQTGLSPEYAAAIRRLVARYGAHGLRVTVVQKTQGYWLRSGIETGPKTPEQEAALDSAYYLNYLRLPVTVAVVASPMQTLGNGWVMPVYPSLPYEDRNVGWTVVLADTTGRLVRKFAGMQEKQINAYLDRLLGLTDRDMPSAATSPMATGQKR